jgi:hypothetical protein
MNNSFLAYKQIMILEEIKKIPFTVREVGFEDEK